MISYRKKYIKIYFWQALSTLLGFVSLFVVIPYLSSDKILYGIYSICTSLTIFFSYADLGFISAGVKYAAEYYIKGDKNNEMKVIGFTAFIMISVFLVVAITILILAIYPCFLIPDLEVGSENYDIARALLLTLAISCPIIIGQRILGIIFTIRVEDYMYQRMMIIGNIIRILSVLYFFSSGHYRIVEYYIFYQIVNFIIVLCGLIYIRHYGYKMRDFLYTIQFDKVVFNKVKKISGTSLVMTICMILYYELDQIAISYLVGIEALAMYGVALSVLTLIRTYCSIIFSPYTSRHNHYVGLNDVEGLTSFVNKMILLFGVILVIPIATVSVFAEPFVISWVGSQYVDSAILVSFMVLSFIPNYIKDPVVNYFVATERNSILLKYNCLMPIIYWLGVFATINFWGIKAFALFKFVTPVIFTFNYWRLVNVDFKDKGCCFVSFKDAVWPLVYPLFCLGILGYFILPHMFYNHDNLSLLLNIFIMGLCLVVTMVVGVFTNRTFKKEIIHYSSIIIGKIRNKC